MNNIKDSLINALLGQQADETQFDNVDEFTKALLSSPNATEILSSGTDPQAFAESAKQGLNMGNSWIADLQKQYKIDIPKTEEEVNQARLGTFNPPIMSSGVSQTPRVGGILPDMVAGMKDNINNSFDVQNLAPNGKGFAYKLGEGLGTATRLLDSPIARGLISAGLVSMAGGNKSTMIREGLAGAVGRQNAKTQDQVYRNQLKQYGYNDDELASITGNINNEIYKNLATNIYKNRKLDQDSYIKMKNQYDRMLQNGMLSPTEYQQVVANLNNKYIEDTIVTTESGSAQESNQTKDVRSKEQFRKDVVQNGANRNNIYGGLGYGALNLNKANSEVSNGLKRAQTEQIKAITEALKDEIGDTNTTKSNAKPVGKATSKKKSKNYAF